MRNTVVTFLFFALLGTAAIWISEEIRIEQQRVRITSLGSESAHAIQLNIEAALSAAYALAALVQQSRGNMPEFESTARAMLSFYPSIAALQLAPGGVVKYSVPLAGNEKAIGHNLLRDPKRDTEAFLAKNTGKLTLAGPFELVQGGIGAAGRLPVYLEDENGIPRFWGFVTVLIRFPNVLETARLVRLVEQGYAYKLWRVHPDTGARHVIASSTSAALIKPVDMTLNVPNAVWTLSVAPRSGWIDPVTLAIKAALGLLLSLVLTFFWRKSP